MSGCRSVGPLLDTFIDGELPAERLLDVEQHLASCALCTERVRFAESVRASTRRAALADAEPTAAFEARLRSAMAAERASEPAELVQSRAGTARSHGSPHDRSAGDTMLSWRAIASVAAAAAVPLFLAASVSDGGSRATKPQAISSAASLDGVLDDIVNAHVRTTSPAVTESGLVSNFEPEVGVPVRMPQLQQYGARWEGGTVVPMRNHRAASFRFRVHGHRVTLYVYDAKRVPLRAELEARVVRNVPVFVGQRRGYSIAAVEQRGVGHALTTDMSDAESAELIVASVH